MNRSVCMCCTAYADKKSWQYGIGFGEGVVTAKGDKGSPKVIDGLQRQSGVAGGRQID